MSEPIKSAHLWTTPMSPLTYKVLQSAFEKEIKDGKMKPFSRPARIADVEKHLNLIKLLKTPYCGKKTMGEIEAILASEGRKLRGICESCGRYLD